jgi:hypothetical protein
MIRMGEAPRLAYYKAEPGSGVLAPRGWNCFETYGSSGGNLYVTPDSIRGNQVFSADWKGFSGAAIQISDLVAGTSGRFEVGRIIARVFPSHMEFVKDVIAEEIEPASDFPIGPYPKDLLTYRNHEVVEFETPANTKGLGTDSRLSMNSSTISGVAVLDEESNITILFARLPEGAKDLLPAIVRQVEREKVGGGNSADVK